jgi:hypothetical protein
MPSGDLNRRTFVNGVAATFVMPSAPFGEDDERFFRRVTATLITASDLRRTGIDPVENLRHLLERTQASHRQRISRLISGVRRVSFLYGGAQVALRGRTSRFELMPACTA